MSAGENYEVHVALTGLNEAITGLESFESRLKQVGTADTPISTAFVGRLAEAKSEVISLQASIRETIASLSQDLAKGIVPSGSLTSGLVQDVERTFGRVDTLAREFAQTFPAELKAIGNQDFIGNFDGLRKGIVEATKQAANEVRQILKEIGLGAGLSEGQLRPVLGNAGGLNSALGARTRASEANTADLPEALDASRALADSAIKITRAIKRVDAHFGETLVALEKAALGEDPGEKFRGLSGRVTQQGPKNFQVQNPVEGVQNVRVVEDASTGKRSLSVERPPAVPAPEQVRIFRGENAEAASAGTAKGGEDLRGRFFTQDLSLAREYAGEFGKVFSTLVTEEGLGKAREEAGRRSVVDGLVVPEDVARAATLFNVNEDGGGGGRRPPGGPTALPFPEPDENGRFPDNLGSIGPEEAARLVDEQLASRTSSKGRGAGFNLPTFTGAGQSPFFDIVPAGADESGQLDGPPTLRRVTKRSEVQQLEDDPTDLVARRRAAFKVEEEIYKEILGQQEVFNQRQRANLTEQVRLGREEVARQENAGVFKKQGSFSTLDDQGQLRRRSDGTVIQSGDDTFNQDIGRARIEQVTSARREAENQKKVAAANAGLGGTFLGGFTSKGFENPGQGILPALVGTAGVLARYSVDGAAFGAVALGIKSVLTSTEEYQAALIDLEEATRGAGAGQIDLQRGFAEGSKFGLSEAETINIGTAAIKNYSSEIERGASASDIYNQAIRDVGVNAIITGQKVEESAKQVFQASNQFNLGPGGGSQINDAVFNASKRFNAAPGEIQKGLVASGDLANVAGFSTDRLASTVAAVSSQGENASGLSRLLGRGGNAQFRQAIANLGVTDSGNTAGELDKAAVAYSNLTDARKRDFVEQAGGARQAGLLIALLKTNAEVNQSVAASYTDAGSATQHALDIQNTAAGQIKQFFTELKQLGTELGKSGLADIFILLFEVLKSGLGLVDAVAKAFNAVTDQAGPLKHLVITALELVAVLKVLGGLSAGNSAVAGVQSLISGVRNKVATTAVAAGENAAGSAAGSLAGGAIAGAATRAAATEAEVASVSLLGVLTGKLKGIASFFSKGFGAGAGLLTTELAGAAAIGAGVVTAVIGDVVFTAADIAKTKQLNKVIAETNDAQGTGNFTAKGLEDSAKSQSLAAANARQSSRGILGTTSNFFLGLTSPFTGNQDTGQAARAAERRSAVAAAEADAARVAETNAQDSRGLAGNFNFNSTDVFTAGNKVLADRGLNSTQIAAQQFRALDLQTALTNGSKSFLGAGQGGVLAGQVGDNAVKELVRAAGSSTFGSASAGQKISGLGEQSQVTIARSIGSAVSEFVSANKLEGQDLTKLPQGQLHALAEAAKARIIKDLEIQGLTAKEITAILPEVNRAAFAAVGEQVRGINTKSGVKLTTPQITDLINQAQGTATSVGARAGVQQALTGGLTSDQQGADLKAQAEYFKGLRDRILASDPSADISVLDDAIATTKLAAVNQAGNQAKSLAKFATDLLSPLDVSGRLKAELDGINKAIASGETGDALRADTARKKQIGFQQGTRANVDAPSTALALSLDPRSATAGAQLALFRANKDLTDAKAQQADDITLGQKREAVRQAQQALNVAQTSDANAQAASNVVLGDKVGQLQARYKALIAQSQNETGGQRAATLREAQQTLIDVQVANAENAQASALSGLDPRDKIGKLRQDLAGLQAKVFAPGDVAGKAGNVTATKALQQQIIDETNAQNASIANAGLDQRDRVGQASQAVKNAATNLKAQEPGTKAYADALLSLKSAQLAYAVIARSVADAAEQSRVFAGDPLGEARSRLDASTRALAAAKKGQPEYYAALKANRDAQVAYAAAAQDAADVVRQLGEDRTDPVTGANEALRKAQEKLARDRKAGAPKAITDQDQLAVDAAAQGKQKAVLDQQVGDAQTAFQLHQISGSTYLQFLESQRASILKQLQGTKQGTQGYRQLFDEFQKLNGDILSANQQLTGQFNIGNIGKLPTIFQERVQAIANGIDIKPVLDTAQAFGAGNGPLKTVAVATFLPLKSAIETIQTSKTVTELAKLQAAITSLGISATAAPKPTTVAAVKPKSITPALSQQTKTVNVVFNGADVAIIKRELTNIIGTPATSTRTTTSKRRT